jgi:hypothetical protein
VAALTEVESVLPEKTMAISGAKGRRWTPTTSTSNSPSISSVWASVPEKHACGTTMFKHLKPEHVPTTTEMPCSLPVAPAMATIVVDRVPTVNE